MEPHWSSASSVCPLVPHDEVSNALLPALGRESATRTVAIKLDVAAVKTGDGVAPLQQRLQRPTVRVLAALAHRVAGRDNSRIGIDSLVSVIQPQEQLRRSAPAVRHVQQQIDRQRVV